MSSTCILTDNTAQLSLGAFPGQRLIKTLPLKTENQQICAPAVDDFLRAFAALERDFSGILALTISSHLLPAVDIAQQAAAQHGGMVHISVLDSQQTGAGLGILAQIGAQAAAAGHTLIEVEEKIRAAIPHIYTLLYVEPENLSRHPHLIPLLADSGEAPFPLFLLEEGQLAPYKKVRTKRHLLESFQEFIEEFEHPQQIVFQRGTGNPLRARPLRELTRDLFPGVVFSEVEIPAPLATLLGPQSTGVIILEMPVKPL
jgi:fatty acid-binding protein DegV